MNLLLWVDIILVALLVYGIYRLIAGSTAVTIVLGYAVVYLVYIIIQTLHLHFLEIILANFIKLGPIISIVLFQREIRYGLSTVGKGFGLGKAIAIQIFPWTTHKRAEIDISPVVKAAQALGGSNMGAIIVFTKDADLRYYENSGDLINAIVSSRLLIAIFNKYSPLHDGAVIIHNNKIVAARCILPVTENLTIPAHFGLRHKAAIGLTEITDTLVVVVSEESGQISIARNGKIESNLSAQEIRSTLKDYLHSGWSA